MLGWNLSSAHPLPPPWDLNPDVMFASRNLFRNEIVSHVIPQLSARTLHYARLPRAGFAYISAPLFSDTLPQPACPADEADVVVGNVNRAQLLLYRPSSHLTPPLPNTRSVGAVPLGKSRARSARPKARLPPIPTDGVSSVRDMERNVSDCSAYRRHLENRRGVMVAPFPPPNSYDVHLGSPISLGVETLPPMRNVRRLVRIAVIGLQLIILLRISLKSPPPC